MPVHVAITRRALPGREDELQQALREFFGESFAFNGVLGASLLVPGPGSPEREFGILRTFAGEAERDAFYASPMFLAWEERARPMTEGEPVYRELHGLEAWFRSAGGPPPRWKMALATFAGVYLVSALLNLALGRALQPLPLLLRVAISSGIVVVALTWGVMPALARGLRGWLHPARKR